MTYGTTRRRERRALTLDNVTGTDIFCGSTARLAAGRQHLPCRRRQLDRHRHHEYRQQQHQHSATTRNKHAEPRQQHEPARWYSSSITLLNGEVITQGGSGGTDHPEIARPNGAFRLLSGSNTSPWPTCTRATSSLRTAACSATTAPAGCTTSTPTGTDRSATRAICSGLRGRGRQRRHVSARAYPAVRRQLQRLRRHRYQRRDADGNAPAVRCLPNDDWSTPRFLPDGQVLATGGSRSGTK